MGLIDDKQSIFTTIGAYVSLGQSKKLPNATNIYTSINNKKEVVPLLLDILKVVVGSVVLQELTGELFSTFIDNTEPDLKTGVKKQTVQENSDNQLPNDFKNNGYSIPAKSIDVMGKLKTSPNSSSGSMLYDNNSPNFDSAAYQAIQNEGTDTPYNNLIINYNSTTDSFNFKPNTKSNPNQSIGDWMGSFVDSTTIINKKEFMVKVMDSFYGTITSNQNKTTEEIFQELQLKKLIEQLINGDDSFEISQKDYDDLLRRAKQLKDGVVTYDLGCGLMEVSLSLNDFNNLISNISGSTNPFLIGKHVGDTLSKSGVGNNNIQTVTDNFFQTIIKIITVELACAATISPQIRALMAIGSAFQNFGISKLGNPIKDLKGFKVYLKCIIQIAMRLINQFIYNLVIGFLIVLLTPIIKTFVREKINQFIGIIKSLI